MAVIESDGVNHTSDLILRRNGTEGLRITSSTVQLSSINDGYISGNRNRIHNGAMVFNQRAIGYSAPATFANLVSSYSIDRWLVGSNMVNTMQFLWVQDANDCPPGFQRATKFTSISSATATASEFRCFFQRIEGYDIADLDFGKASAKPITLSFYVKSSVTGTHSGAFRNGGSDRSIAFTYTITTANTWEKKFVTVPGDTSGTWSTVNTAGLDVIFDLGTGSNYRKTAYPSQGWTSANVLGANGAVSPMATSGATWFISGVQLEPGLVATPYEFIHISTEAYKMQRYYAGLSVSDTLPVTTFADQGRGFFKLPVLMRVPPVCTFEFQGGSGATFSVGNHGGFQATAHTQISAFSVQAAADLF